jgi:hypothetical protein
MASPEKMSSSIHLQQGIEARQWERFIINKPGTITMINPGLSGMNSRQCHVVDISKGGAGMTVYHTLGLNDHYYLTFLGSKVRIGCAEVYRSGQRVGVRFIKPMPDALLSAIIRNDFLTR